MTSRKIVVRRRAMIASRQTSVNRHGAAGWPQRRRASVAPDLGTERSRAPMGSGRPRARSRVPSPRRVRYFSTCASSRSRTRTQKGLACQRRTVPCGSRRTTVMRSGQMRQLLGEPAVPEVSPDRPVEAPERAERNGSIPQAASVPARVKSGSARPAAATPISQPLPRRDSERFGQSVSARTGGSVPENGSAAQWAAFPVVRRLRRPSPQWVRWSHMSGVGSVSKVCAGGGFGQRPLQRRIGLRAPVGRLGHPLAVAQRVEDDPEEEEEASGPTGTRPIDET